MKALELAKSLDDLSYSEWAYCMNIFEDAAAELRRLAEVNAELLGALADIRLAAAARNTGYIVDRVDEATAKAKEQQ